MADMSTISADLLDIKNSIKALTKIVRKLKNAQDDPDGEKAKARASNNGFNRPLKISDTLRSFLGLSAEDLICRSDVTRRINEYVTINGLKHPENGRVIILDEKMKELLQPPEGLQITFLNIQKYLSPHYEKIVKESKPKVKKEESVPAPTQAPASTEAPIAHKAKRPVVKKAASAA